MQVELIKKELDKGLLQKRFSSALYTYDTHALVQKYMAEVLVEVAQKYISSQQSYMLELGCGTGLLTHEIIKHYSARCYTANDLVGEFTHKIAAIVSEGSVNDFQFVPGDAAHLHLNKLYDIIWSGATIQWIENLEVFFFRMNKVLNEGGYFMLSSFNVDNFKEIKSITGEGIDYKSMQEVIAYASKYFKVLECKSWHQNLWFKEPTDVLKHMRYTGVNGVAATTWGKRDLQNFVSSYESFKQKKGYPLCYHPFILILQKQ